MKYVAIIGSRDYPNPEDVQAFVDQIPLGWGVISGGARGVDSVAEEAATIRRLPVISIRPDYKRFGRGAPLIRNRDIIAQADAVAVFMKQPTPGTVHALEHARHLNKPIFMGSGFAMVSATWPHLPYPEQESS